MVNGLEASSSPGRCGRSMNMFPFQNRASSSGPCSGMSRGPDVVAGVRLAGSILAVVLWFTLVSYPARANPLAGTATFVLQAGSANLVGFLEPPFDVRSETATNYVGYILATSAGFLQNFIYGFIGLRVEDGGVVQAYPPLLPRAWISLTLKNVSLRGRHYNIVVRRDAMGKVILQRRLLLRRTSEKPE